MSAAHPFGTYSTADQVLAGIDLTGKRFVVTGINSGIGFETMNSLAANGAQVIGLARTLAAATAACKRAGPTCTPLACDLADFESVAEAAVAIIEWGVPLDSIVASATAARLPTLQTRHGIEMQFLVNHVGHFALVNRLSDIVRDGTGRIVIVSSSAGIHQAPPEGIMFDNLDGHRSYRPQLFYGQSKLAGALYAKELSRRLLSRGIAVNSLHPGTTKGTQLNKYLRWPLKFAAALMKPLMRSAQRGAATPALLAASPRVAGISGEYWSNCQIVPGSPLLRDASLAARLWEVSERIVTERTASGSLQRAAA